MLAANGFYAIYKATLPLQKNGCNHKVFKQIRKGKKWSTSISTKTHSHNLAAA